jgi:methyltransferase-like protein/2-polyprenyl-3-methyl-5-hydroxy-6-metoxy-1,4-benzoquinol methylase
MPQPMHSTYDEVPYINAAFPQTHPDRLATLGKLFGMTPPDIDTSRVLELGCASGDNLIPMALGLPRAQFLGIDMSHRQVDQGRETLRRLNLANIELRQADIASVDAGWGRFDYVICHGIYSWVPAPVREKILAICRENLAPNGVAYVSYNTLPGWRMRGTVRDMMVFHASEVEGATAKLQQARALLDFIAQSVPANTAYSMLLKGELEAVNRGAEAYLFHEYIEDVNEPVYFHEFARAAQASGLQYVAEAKFSDMMVSNFPPQITETLRQISSNLIRLEQYMDFLRNRMLRQTLLTHQEVPLNRNLEWQTVSGFVIASAAKPVSPALSLAQGVPEAFRAPGGATFTTANTITKAAMLALLEAWPRGVPFVDLEPSARARVASEPGAAPDAAALAQNTRLIGEAVLRCFVAGVVELHLWSPALCVTPSARPTASPLARLQAARDGPVTNLRHGTVEIDGLDRRVLTLLDGTRDRDALVATLEAQVREGILDLKDDRSGATLANAGGLRDLLQRAVDDCIANLARSALLIG